MDINIKDYMTRDEKIKEIKDSVKNALDDEGLYSSILDNSIEDFAEIKYLKTIAFEDATKDDARSYTMETSREGNQRSKVNPAYAIYLDFVRESQKILDGLCMTAKSAGTTQGDDFDELKDKMSEANNG